MKSNLFNCKIVLFKKNKLYVRDEIRKHIEEILPDYYGIRK